MARFTKITATNARFAAASRALVADEEKGTQARFTSVLSLATPLRRALRSCRSTLHLPLAVTANKTRCK
jgi:hypothetical protein